MDAQADGIPVNFRIIYLGLSFLDFFGSIYREMG